MDDTEKTALEYSGRDEPETTDPGINPADYVGEEEDFEMPEWVRTVPMQVKKLPHFPTGKVLGRKTPGSSGIDLFAAINSPIRLNIIGAKALVPTGISIALPMGYEAQVRPRSGLSAKHGVTVLNTPGTVDSDYRGEIYVIMILLAQGKFTVEPGDRIAQLIINEITYPEIEYVDELDDTSRGEGGFGHTGLK